MAALHITKENFKSEVLEAKEPVLVDFWASWCGPCKMLGPVIEEISEENTGAKICKIDVDEQQELAMQYNVMSIPTLIVFRDGKEAGRAVGYIPKSEVLALLNK